MENIGFKFIAWKFLYEKEIRTFIQKSIRFGDNSVLEVATHKSQYAVLNSMYVERFKNSQKMFYGCIVKI